MTNRIIRRGRAKTRGPRSWAVIAGRLSLVGLAYLLVFFWSQGKPDSPSLVYARVIDGDTLRMKNGEKIRLIGLDTPEVAETDKLFRDARRTGESPQVIQARGRQATRFAREIVTGKPLRLEFDLERTDRYGRTLAYVYVPVCEWDRGEAPCVVDKREAFEYRQLPGLVKDHGFYIFLNASLLNAGYAEPLNIRPNIRYEDYFHRLFVEAKKSKRGLWGGFSRSAGPSTRP